MALIDIFIAVVLVAAAVYFYHRAKKQGQVPANIESAVTDANKAVDKAVATTDAAVTTAVNEAEKKA